ncbi:hypothetical protein [Alistipes sp.]|uniref:hypothetical protein n=1 Tax=Alistipes sp. TaxID=1872444 RepID=UPI003AF08A00
MDLKQIREELRRLTALTDGWSATEELPAVERDLALDKLRALYDAVRFAGGSDAAPEETAADPAPKAVPVDLGLDVLLPPIVPVPDREADSYSSAPDKPAVAETAAEKPMIEEAAADLSAATESPAPEPIVAPLPVPDSEVVSEPVSEPEATPEPELASEAVSEPTSEPEPKPQPEHGHESMSEPEPEPVSPPEPKSEPAPAPQPVVGSLFGFEEEETLRHRRKQRVIMSLYDVEEPAPKPAGSERPGRREEAPQPPVREFSGEPAAPKEVPAPAVEATPKTAPQAIPEPEPVPETPETVDTLAAEKPGPEQTALPTGSVLGEVINQDVQTLADTLEAPRDVATELKRREPVTDLERAIGINDKFLMIRDLFNGDAAAYETAIRTLNGFEELDDCMIHIAEHYAWNPNSDGAKLMAELLERKFS